MGDLHGKKMISPEATRSPEPDSFEEFENNLREENMRLLRNLRLQEKIGKVKSNDPDQ